MSAQSWRIIRRVVCYDFANSPSVTEEQLDMRFQ